MNKSEKRNVKRDLFKECGWLWAACLSIAIHIPALSPGYCGGNVFEVSDEENGSFPWNREKYDQEVPV